MPLRMPKFRFTRRLGKILLGVVAVALILCGVAAWQVPKVLHDVLTQDVAKMLGRDVAVGKITFNPFTLTVDVYKRQECCSAFHEVSSGCGFIAAWAGKIQSRRFLLNPLLR